MTLEPTRPTARRPRGDERFLILGNLDNRRVTGFVEALARAGWPAPILLGHRALLDDLGPLAAIPDQPLWVRIDSLGEDPEVERRLLARGWGAVTADDPCERISPAALAASGPRFGQLLAPRQLHAGVLDYFDALAELFARRPSWRVLNPIADLKLLFDKRETSRRYAAAGIPVPEPVPGAAAIATGEQLRAAMVERRWPAVFVKLSCGSSASGVALYRHVPGRPPGQRDLLLTTVAQTPAGRFNSLRLQRIEARERVDALLAWLLGEGAQIERAIVKARVDRHSFDLRVLVVAGEPAACVVRQSRHPITNLHLGGSRGDLEAVRARIDPGDWAAAMRSCARVSAEHRCHHVGVDLLFEADLRGHRVIEANAFGDLLPGLTTAAGCSVYEHEIAALPAPHSSHEPGGRLLPSRP